MPFSVYEKWESGEGGLGLDANDEIIAIIRGTPPQADGSDNGDDPRLAQIYAGTVFPSVSALGNTIKNLDRKRAAPYTWLFTGKYSSPWENRQTNDAAFSFNTGGSTQHIQYSRKTVQQFIPDSGPDDAGPDTNQAINATATSIEGVDIHTRTFDFKTTLYTPQQKMTNDYVDLLFNRTGCVNNDSVTIVIDGVQFQFDPGELLFLGAEGSKRKGFGDWELGLQWSASPNATSLSIGTEGTASYISGIVKNGWDYLWVLSETSPDMDAKVLVQTPILVSVEQVYDYQPLSGILLATAFGPTNKQDFLNPPVIEGASGGIISPPGT